MMDDRWLTWARDLQAISQNGLAYCKNEFDIERFEQVRQIAVEILAAHSGHEPSRLLDIFGGEEGYATPKVDVRGAVFRDGKILMVSELLDAGRWTLPGGWADAWDTPSGAVIREIREESGFEARAVKLAMVYDRAGHGHPKFYFSVYKFFFLCEITGGEASLSKETGGVEFFSEDQLPELSTTRVTAEEIHRLFDHYRSPDLPTDFD